jgi:oxygen-independent coproporphyrinogen III oxidase
LLNLFLHLAGIYIHVPFCKQACSYCDFYFSTKLIHKEVVVKSLLKEIELRHSYLSEKKVESIYFGGGTPSLLSKKEFEEIFTALNFYFDWDADAEITLEANPDDVNKEVLTTWKELGINRLSIGLQSFNNDELSWMNRAHTAIDSVRSVNLAQDKGFNNISIDLIYGSKFQTLRSWEHTLKQAILLNTQHISAYNLTIESKTVLGTHYQQGKEPAVDETLSSKQFLCMLSDLEQAEFIHYEISNFGKKNFFAINNSNYWLQKPYLGLGPSAHSFNGNARQWNVKNNNLYVKALHQNTPFFEIEELSLKNKYNEYVLTRLRTIWGCDILEIEQHFGYELAMHFKKIITNKLTDVTETDGVFRLSKSGKLRADSIAADLFVL